MMDGEEDGVAVTKITGLSEIGYLSTSTHACCTVPTCDLTHV